MFIHSGICCRRSPTRLFPRSELRGVYVVEATCQCGLVSSTIEATGSDDGSHVELVVLADEWARVIVSNDADLIASFTAADWVIVSESGISSRDDFLAVVGSGELTHSAMDRVGEPRIRVYGDTAVFTARVTNTAHHGGQRFDADEWTTDVFVRRGSRWQCVLTHLAAAAG